MHRKWADDRTNVVARLPPTCKRPSSAIPIDPGKTRFASRRDINAIGCVME